MPQYELQILGGDHAKYLDDLGLYQHLDELVHEHKYYKNEKCLKY